MLAMDNGDPYSTIHLYRGILSRYKYTSLGMT